MSASSRIRNLFKTQKEWDAFVETVARAALMAYFDPNGSPIKKGAGGHAHGDEHRAAWTQFGDMKENNQRRSAVREVERVLLAEAADEDRSSSGGAGGPSGGAGSPEFEASPGWWQPEVKITGGEWSTKLPEGRSAPHIRQGRVFGIFHDDNDNLTPFRIFYVDDKHAGMGPIYSSHGVWSLDFFTPDGNGIVVNDDEPDDGEYDNPPLSVGGPYRLRFRKISEPGKAGR